MRKYIQGKYKPINPQKYMGDLTNIIFRSSWEKKFFIWCDNNPNILRWSSEEIIIPYRCPTDDRIHRYFPDARIDIKTKDNEYKTYLIEIKPFAQTLPPKKQKRKTKRYITEVYTYGKNEAKWKAARQYAKERNWEFLIITEKELNIK